MRPERGRESTRAVAREGETKLFLALGRSWLSAELPFPKIVLQTLLKQTDSLCGVEERCEAHIQYWNPLSSI